ncbi:MAG TPA: DHH family phosphoesterase [Thermoanaerobaculia bacterium]|nr:DHH family phosphoesterase [Thermoanaerobaculia bacterium]
MTPDFASAQRAFAEFVEATPLDARVLVFHDSDADGVTAGVVLQRALERRGFTHVARSAPTRERDAWSAANRELIAASNPEALFLLDLGSRDEPLVKHARCCLIDHHHPDGVPPDALLITAYAWDPIPNTSLMVYDLCASLADIEDLDWVAAIGVLSDLGERAPFPLLASVKKKYAMSDLKEATTLVNAARRASEYQPETAARALLAHDTARDLVRSSAAEVEALRAAREEVKVAMAEAKKAAPKFAGNVALIRVHSRCQVHPVIAQIWRTRLPKYIVIVANDGYLPGRVNFSARSASGINLLEFLRSFDLGEGEGSYARGHDQATGGSLPLDRWRLLLSKIGFAV